MRSFLKKDSDIFIVVFKVALKGTIMENKSLITEFKRDSIGTMRTSVDQFMHPLFCLKDACLILGIKNVSDAKKRLRAEGVKKVSFETSGGVQNLLYVNEPNLYRLIFQSRKEEAQAFMDWVVEDILPSIRRIGRYDVQSITNNTETAIQFLDAFHELTMKNAILEHTQQEVAEVKKYVKRALDSYALVDLFDVATLLGIKGVGTVAILSILRSKNILDDCNLPYQEYIDKGWFRVDTHTYQKKDSGIVKNTRVFVYKVGLNNIKKIMKEYAGEKNG